MLTLGEALIILQELVISKHCHGVGSGRVGVGRVGISGRSNTGVVVVVVVAVPVAVVPVSAGTTTRRRGKCSL